MFYTQWDGMLLVPAENAAKLNNLNPKIGQNKT